MFTRSYQKNIQTHKDGQTILVQTDLPTDEIKQGESIAVDGVCLTVVSTQKFLAFDISPETLKRSTFKTKKTGNKVNLERALKLSDRLGGHIVTGHIDGTGYIKTIKRKGDFTEIGFTAPKNILKYIVGKGSVAIDGISLTVNNLFEDGFNIMVIPHTLKETTLKLKKIGELVNIENDIIGKYVEKFSAIQNNSGKGITEDFLEQFNFK